MGEAKRNRERKRRELIEMFEMAIIEDTPLERRLFTEMNARTPEPMTKAPADVIAYMRMKPRECHQNCTSYLRLAQEAGMPQQVQLVTGWLRMDGDYLWHTVVRIDGKLVCITPSLPGFEMKSVMPFYPDHRIDIFNGTIDGEPIPLNLREDPQVMNEEAKFRIAAIKAAKNPYDGMLR